MAPLARRTLVPLGSLRTLPALHAAVGQANLTVSRIQSRLVGVGSGCQAEQLLALRDGRLLSAPSSSVRTFFLQHLQRGHLGQRLFLASELALDLLVPQLAKGAAGLAQSGHSRRAKLFPPLDQLVLENATLAAPTSRGCVAKRVAFLQGR